MRTTRWNSSRISTLRWPSTGERLARSTISRACSAVIQGPVRSVITRSGWAPANARRRWRSASVPLGLGRQQRGGEGQRQGPLAGSPRPHQQVGVHGRLDRGPQLGHGPVLAHDRRPRISGRSRGSVRSLRRGHRPSCSRSATTSPTPIGHLVDRADPVDHRPPVRVGGGQGAEASGHPAVERLPLLLESVEVVAQPAVGHLRVDLEQHHQVGPHPVGGPLARAGAPRRRPGPGRSPGRPSTTRRSGRSRRGARRPAPGPPPRATCWARSAAISSASARGTRPRSSPGPAGWPAAAPRPRAARLAGQHRVEPPGQQAGLGRLAAALAALEGDEPPRLDRPRPPGLGQSWALAGPAGTAA